VRAVGVHEDVLVVTSQTWATTCTAWRAGDEGFLLDSPVLPEELEALPALLAQAGFPVSGLLATHADWDHVLGRLAFPGASLGVAETTAARLRAEPGAAQRALREFDERWYVRRSAPLTLGDVQALPVPGHLELGGRELELHPADGHTADGMAVWAPWAGVLCPGDYLSPVEIPMLSPGGSLDGYVATLHRLRPLVEAAETVVPGHGGPIDRERALRILVEDESYLEALREHGVDAPLPEGRRTAEQRRIHAENAANAHSRSK
jgi:glyoxylase-like metal-dependent hydrolase (beta-lactamase superfamily II)